VGSDFGINHVVPVPEILFCDIGNEFDRCEVEFRLLRTKSRKRFFVQFGRSAKHQIAALTAQSQLSEQQPPHLVGPGKALDPPIQARLSRRPHDSRLLVSAFDRLIRGAFTDFASQNSDTFRAS
jgi:hypothetical protein